MEPTRSLFDYRPHWAESFGVAPFLPTTRAEMDALGWDACDVILVTGDAYVDHPSFGMAVVGRLLEAHGFRVGIIAQPEWRSAEAFAALGRPNLFWGVTAGNMDSMVNRYTSDRKVRNDDAYTPDAAPGMRPDRAALVYAHRCREAFRDVPIVLGGIESSLRRIAHYDYWQDKVRRSILIDAKADLLLFGNAERALVEVAHRLARGERVDEIRDLRGSAYLSRGLPEGFVELDSTDIDTPGPVERPVDPYAAYGKEGGDGDAAACANDASEPAGAAPARGDLVPLAQVRRRALRQPRERQVIRLPSYEQVAADPVLYAHASRVLHREANPHNARALVQRHGDFDVWLTPPPVPLSTEEMDRVFELPYQRVPHPVYGDARIPAYEMIRFSVTITRGCFGGCTFCSITEHEGRIIQNRSEDSILREIERIRDTVPGFTGVISDLGGPTANMWRLACKSRAIEAACRRPSCVYPGICENLGTDQTPLVSLYRKARALPGIDKILIASGVRYDLAVETPSYVRELVTHHVGGYLKIAPEHVSRGPLAHMMKPGIGTYERFKELFERYSKAAGKKQYLIPYFIAAHPGTTDEDMLELALWLKRNGFRADQVQTFLPSPMATATAMYHTGKNPLARVHRARGEVPVPKGLNLRRLHKAFLRWHAPESWPLLRKALRRMGREDLIGGRRDQLVPHGSERPGRGSGHGGRGRGGRGGERRPAPGQRFLTKHTGLPPAGDSAARAEAGAGADAGTGSKPPKRRSRRRRPRSPATGD
ncbi:YgiQ family radical SAM protein [Haliangium ochraceum]|uniref:Radical SAM domain protein n=1 Tax=Haliangium ochraceum (strain DSM 14365 / JCM 11303 / SMP-2) TaxID=502025 RepID=D0LQ74_HALO1|nr:YgiQ family radical SAM protein [Haliangium ochraceum]ACY18883.1 Radical SAM domain protein [Haliangium ochraceum DSM 14365]